MRERFVREAKIQARLEHPAIVPVYDLGQDEDGQPYFTMKRLRGDTLDEILSGTAAADLTQHQLLQRFAEVCLAVEYAHQHGVVHRDIKPSNIMLGAFGEVYLLDWGIAKAISEAAVATTGTFETAEIHVTETQTDMVLGTLGYMSPEQLVGATLDDRADVFSLGAVLFEILTDAPLIVAKERLRHIQELGVDLDIDVRARLLDLDEEIAPELRDLCSHATAHERSKRISSARELHDRLVAFLAGESERHRRRRLAEAHVRSASRFASDSSVASRRRALVESARAIAFDPENLDAQKTLESLLVRPMTELPPEVERGVERARMARAQRGIGWATLVYLATLVALPLAWLVEMRSWGELLILEGALIGTCAVALRFSRHSRPTLRMYWMAIAGNATYLALVSRIMGPIALTPAIAILSTSLFVQHGVVRRWWPSWRCTSLPLLVRSWLASGGSSTPR